MGSPSPLCVVVAVLEVKFGCPRTFEAFSPFAIVEVATLKTITRRPPLKGFAVIGAVASFLSALLGSVGPLMAPLFLAYGLVKGAYIGTEALSTVVMHVAKLIAYRRAAVLPIHAILVGLPLGAIMVIGSFVGKRIVDRLPGRIFVLIIEATLVAAGLLFLWKG